MPSLGNHVDAVFIPESVNTSTTLRINGGDLHLDDGKKALFGQSDDLQIYHDGSSSYINDAGVGGLRILSNRTLIKNAANTVTLADFTTADNSVILYKAGSARLQTTTTGVTVTGTVISDGLSLGDNEVANFGEGNDLQIYHESTFNNSVIKETGGGNLLLGGGNIDFRDAGLGETYALFKDTGTNTSVELYYDDSKKLETTSTGVTVTGTIATTGLTVTNDASVNGINFGHGNNNVGGNILIGDGLSSITSGNNNIAIGSDRALEFNTSGGGNIAIGGDRPLWNNTTGGGNIAIGSSRQLGYNTTGSGNIAIGDDRTLHLNTTGSSNIALGRDRVLENNDSGGGNIAIGGYFTLHDNTSGNDNVAIGSEALKSNTTADHNIALGNKSLYSNSTGEKNVVIGFEAGYYIGGSNNTIIGGYKGGSLDASLSNTVIISAGTTEKLRIDSSGNVGIGTDNPTDRLHVVGSIKIQAGAPIIKLAETGVTGNPSWWIVQDAGNFSLRNNNASPYPFRIVTKGTNSDETDFVAFGGDTIQDALKLTAHGTGPTYLDLKGNNANARMRYFEGATERWNIGYDTNIDSFTFYDTQNSSSNVVLKDGGNVGIGATNPTEKLEVDGVILSSGPVVDTVWYKETWPAYNETTATLAGNDLGTWTLTGGALATGTATYAEVDTANLPSGLKAVRWNSGAGGSILTSPTIDLSDFRTNQKITTVNQTGSFADRSVSDSRIYLTMLLAAQSMDSNAEHMEVQLSNDDGVTFHEHQAFVWQDNDADNTDITDTTWRKVVVDISEFVYEPSTSPDAGFKIRFRGTGGGAGDSYGVSNIYIHDAPIPNKLKAKTLKLGDATLTESNDLDYDEFLEIVSSVNTFKGLVLNGDPAAIRDNYVGVNGADSLVLAADELNAGDNSRIDFRIDAKNRMKLYTSTNAGASEAHLQLIGHTTPTDRSNWRITAEDNGTNGKFSISDYSGGSWTPNLTVLEGGNVGIGEDDPQAKLQIKADSNVVDDYPLTLSNNAVNYGMQFGAYGASNKTFGASSIDYTIEIGGDLILNPTGNVGIGTDSPQTNLEISSGNPEVRVNNSSGGLRRMSFTGPGSNIWYIKSHGTDDNNSFEIVQGSNTRLFIKSGGNFGIGTEDPSDLLHVAGKGRFSGTGSFEALELITSDTNRVFITGNSSATGDMWKLGTSTSNPNLNIDALQSNGEIVLRTGGTNERARIDSDGNVGIGTDNPLVKLHVEGDTATVSIQKSSSNQCLQNLRNSSTELFYVGTTDTNWNVQTNAIQRFSVTSAGNVGIGTTNPTQRLHVHGSSFFGGTTDSARATTIDTNGLGFFRYDDNNLTVPLTIENRATNAVAGHGAGIRFRFGDSSSNAAHDAGRMAFLQDTSWTSNANTHDAKFVISLAQNDSLVDRFIIAQNGTITMGSQEIASNGIEVGRGSGSVAMTINDGKGNANLAFNHREGVPDNTASAQSAGRIECAVDGTNGRMYFELADSTSNGVSVNLTNVMDLDIGVVNVSGNLTATGTVTGGSSDGRLKENLVRISTPLDKIDQLHGYTFDWKAECADVGFTPVIQTNDIGLIAQDVQAVVPQAVAPAPFDHELSDDGTEDVSITGETYLTVQYERLVPLLVEAIKELRQEVETLKSQISGS